MSKKHIITVVIVAIVFAGGGFFAGSKYAQGKTPTNARAAQAGQGAPGGFAGRGGAGGARGGAGGGIVTGQILSVDNGSLTVQLPNNAGSKIVLYSASTPITKTASGTAADLTTGTNVLVTGTANTDGSVTARNISIGAGFMFQGRPGGASSTPAQGQ